MTNSMGHQTLYICYSINDFFVREAGISLIGFFQNNPDYEPEEVFFLDYGIHPANKERLNGIAAGYGKRISFLNAKAVTDPIRREFPNLPPWRGSMAPNAKAFVDRIFPDYVERLLFIDGDTVVSGSVAPLQTLDMEGAVLGAVPSNWVTDDIRRGKIILYSGNSFYINSGVLLYDLAAWRRENCHQMIIDTLRIKKRFKWPDQTLLNNAIPERLIKVLPLKYNYVSHYFHPNQELGWMRLGNIHTDEEIEESIQHPVIIHYVGGWTNARPWHEGCLSRRTEDYFRYKALSPWKDSPLFPPFRDPCPPKTFMEKWYRWILLQMQVCPSFRFVNAMSAIYSAVGRIIEPFKKHHEYEPSEGMEAIDAIENE